MNWKRLGWIAGALAAVAIGTFAWWPKPLWVDGVPVQMGHMQVTVDDLGETRSHDRFMLAAPVAGHLARITLRDGDAVEDRQLLARIAPLPMSMRERNELMARVASAEAIQREVAQRVRQAENDVSQAQRDLARMRHLARDGFMAEQGLENANQRELAAVAALDAVRYRARAASADVKVAQAGFDALKATQSGVQGWVEVRAPLSGRVLRITDVSERVVPVGAPLMVLGDVNHLEIVVELLSTEAVKVARNIRCLPIASLIGEAIGRTNREESVSSLFE